jgi:hypothetical protein
MWKRVLNSQKEFNKDIETLKKNQIEIIEMSKHFQIMKISQTKKLQLIASSINQINLNKILGLKTWQMI